MGRRPLNQNRRPGCQQPGGPPANNRGPQHSEWEDQGGEGRGQGGEGRDRREGGRGYGREGRGQGEGVRGWQGPEGKSPRGKESGYAHTAGLPPSHAGGDRAPRNSNPLYNRNNPGRDAAWHDNPQKGGQGGSIRQDSRGQGPAQPHDREPRPNSQRGQGGEGKGWKGQQGASWQGGREQDANRQWEGGEPGGRGAQVRTEARWASQGRADDPQQQHPLDRAHAPLTTKHPAAGTDREREDPPPRRGREENDWVAVAPWDGCRDAPSGAPGAWDGPLAASWHVQTQGLKQQRLMPPPWGDTLPGPPLDQLSAREKRRAREWEERGQGRGGGSGGRGPSDGGRGGDGWGKGRGWGSRDRGWVLGEEQGLGSDRPAVRPRANDTSEGCQGDGQPHDAVARVSAAEPGEPVSTFETWGQGKGGPGAEAKGGGDGARQRAPVWVGVRSSSCFPQVLATVDSEVANKPYTEDSGAVELRPARDRPSRESSADSQAGLP